MEKYHRLLGDDIVEHIEWIEGELRSMQEEPTNYGKQEAEWERQLGDVASDAKDAIDLAGRSGVLNWFNNYKLRKKFVQIRKRISDIEIRMLFETAGEGSSSLSSTKSSHLLDDEASWKLFTTHLKVDISLNPKLIKVGKEIVMKCGGLESQISKMSDLLSHQDVPLTHEAWTSVLKGHQFNEDQRNSWSKTLHKINNDMSPHLRRCLLYFVHFPADSGIPVRRLVLLWVAEGLVSHSGGEKPPELVAERYLEELIDRNMVQVVKRKYNGKVETCRLPSPLRQLWLTETNDFRSLQPGQQVGPTYGHFHHLSIWKMELRHLFLNEVHHCTFPPQPKRNSLSNLQTLSGLCIDKEAPVKNGLDKLVNIKKLGLVYKQVSMTQEEAMTAQLEAVADWITTLEQLQSLRLTTLTAKPWNLHLKSFENNINLTNMYLMGSFSSSSDLLLSQFPQSLVKLTLGFTKLTIDPMITLKDFPNLQKLCLAGKSYTGTTMVCKSQSFPKLLVFKFCNLENLEAWKIDPGALPSLQSLEIIFCPRLQMLPDGLKHVNTLLELKLTAMPMEINAGPDNIPPNCQVSRK
ncbi:disease resistance protein RPM1 [Trifolium repens]|nr:disease resistance protein RPM1 [Trifolium repens]